MTTLLHQARPLFSLTRGSEAEVVVYGFAVVKVGTGKALGFGHDTKIPSRSTLKPWQFLAADAFGQETFWTIGLASQSAEPYHIEHLRSLANVAQAEITDLVCPSVYPMDSMETAKLRVAHEPKSQWYHPCAGKHLHMLAGCRKNGWDIHGYDKPDHPLQKKVARIVDEWSETSSTWVRDSCGVPNASLPIENQLLMWNKLATSDAPRVTLLKKLWTSHAKLVGGNHRLDTELVELGQGHILAKEGADGLLTVQTMPSGSEPPVGFVIKITHGFNAEQLGLGLWALLESKLGKDLVKNYPTVAQIHTFLAGKILAWIPVSQKLVISDL